jgi:uncharacterized protein YajQ (UPF0234 family)
MPSFDIVSKVDLVELGNAVDIANREVETRFDFKGTGAKFEFANDKITLTAPSDFQLKQMQDILQNKIAKRAVDIKAIVYQEPEITLNKATLVADVKQGIDQTDAKKIVKMIKDSKLKVQASIQGDQVRVSGKKRDDLQSVISLLKNAKLQLPLQYENFRD